MADYAIYFDASKCTGCKGCQCSCKTWNDLPSPLGLNSNVATGSYQSPLDLNGDTRLIITFEENDSPKKWGVEWSLGRRSCMHCYDPGCASVCPTGALSVDADTGFVAVDDELCVGCHACSGACPFDVPRYHADGKIINKCTACLDRIKCGGAKSINDSERSANPAYNEPACVHACLPEALEFGLRDDLLAKAHARVEFLKNKGFEKAVVYGENELEGTHVIYVLKYGVSSYGLPENPQIPLAASLLPLMKPLAGVGAAAVVAGLGVSFLTGLGYKRDELRYDEKTGETINVETREVVKVGNGQEGEE